MLFWSAIASAVREKVNFFSKKVTRKFGGKKIKLYFCNEIKNEMITNLK